jgi:hypothetical protein
MLEYKEGSKQRCTNLHLFQLYSTLTSFTSIVVLFHGECYNIPVKECLSFLSFDIFSHVFLIKQTQLVNYNENYNGKLKTLTHFLMLSLNSFS